MKGRAVYDHWDIENLEITSRSVERILDPLLEQVDILVSQKGFTSRKNGCSKQADSLVNALEDMLKDYMSKGEQIKNEAPERQIEFKSALDDVKINGRELIKNSRECLEDSCNIDKRKLMINSTKAMLSALTRLMIIADIVDVSLLLRIAKQVENSVNRVKESKDIQLLMDNWGKYGVHVSALIDMAGYRQKDLINEQSKLEIAAARGILSQYTPLLLVSSRACVRHPELASAKSNRDFAVKTILEAIEMIIIANSGGQTNMFKKPGELAAAIEEFDKCSIMKADKFGNVEAEKIEVMLNHIVSNCDILISSPCTREENKEGIRKYCTNAQTELKNLIRAYKSCKDGQQSNDELRSAQNSLLQTTEKLKQHLKCSVVDHISDNFLKPLDPLHYLMESAKSGNEDRVESIIPYFLESVRKMVEISNLACSVSSDFEGVQMTRLSADRVEQLCPQIVNASKFLVLRPSSKFAQENMQNFGNIITIGLETLTECVDNITNIWDHLMILELHIRDDASFCLLDAKNGASKSFCENLEVMRSRINRLCKVVYGEMESFKDSDYRRRVEDSLKELTQIILPEFDREIQLVIGKLQRNERVDEATLNEIFNDVREGVHEIWRAVVVGRDQTGYETDASDRLEFRRSRRGRSRSDSEGEISVSQENLLLQNAGGSAKSERAIMKMLSGQNKEVLDKEMAGFFEQRKRLIHEMTKWDDTGNDLVLLAKRMCQILIEMTDFTRGKGPLKNTREVIESAGKISDCGSSFNDVAMRVASQCPNSAIKNDLEKYIERVTLYCHQIKITSRVKADIQDIGGEIIVSGLDSVMSLIESGKNLMAAVVETVKACYIASTKYRVGNTESTTGTGLSPSKTQGIVQWRMKAPRKKPLVIKQNSSELHHSNVFERVDPNEELAQFD